MIFPKPQWRFLDILFLTTWSYFTVGSFAQGWIYGVYFFCALFATQGLYTGLRQTHLEEKLVKALVFAGALIFSWGAQWHFALFFQSVFPPTYSVAVGMLPVAVLYVTELQDHEAYISDYKLVDAAGIGLVVLFWNSFASLLLELIKLGRITFFNGSSGQVQISVLPFSSSAFFYTLPAVFIFFGILFGVVRAVVGHITRRQSHEW